jgi:hypothetical protein
LGITLLDLTNESPGLGIFVRRESGSDGPKGLRSWPAGG